MNELFFELIQVSTGQLDCLNRGPSPEEWQQLYDLSKRHGLTALCYQGVVRLFEYGLRAPQDLSIDWMADAEELGGAETVDHLISVPEISNPVRKRLIDKWISNNSGSLYVYVDKQKTNTPSSAIVLKLIEAYESFHHGTLTMQHVVGCSQVLRKIGIWRFARSMMWIVNHTMAFDATLMPCRPLEVGGRFVLQQITEEKVPLLERIKYRFWRFIKF